MRISLSKSLEGGVALLVEISAGDDGLISVVTTRRNKRTTTRNATYPLASYQPMSTEEKVNAIAATYFNDGYVLDSTNTANFSSYGISVVVEEADRQVMLGNLAKAGLRYLVEEGTSVGSIPGTSFTVLTGRTRQVRVTATLALVTAPDDSAEFIRHVAIAMLLPGVLSVTTPTGNASDPTSNPRSFMTMMRNLGRIEDKLLDSMYEVGALRRPPSFASTVAVPYQVNF